MKVIDAPNVRLSYLATKKKRRTNGGRARAPVALIILVIGLILGLIYVLAGS